MDVASHRDEITFILDGWGVTYISHSIYGTGIFTYIYIWSNFMVNVGKYTIPMASMGIQCQHIVLKHQIYKSNTKSTRSNHGQTYCPIAIPAGLLRTRIIWNCFNLGSQIFVSVQGQGKATERLLGMQSCAWFGGGSVQLSNLLWEDLCLFIHNSIMNG